MTSFNEIFGSRNDLTSQARTLTSDLDLRDTKTLELESQTHYIFEWFALLDDAEILRKNSIYILDSMQLVAGRKVVNLSSLESHNGAYNLTLKIEK